MEIKKNEGFENQKQEVTDVNLNELNSDGKFITRSLFLDSKLQNEK